MEITKDDFTTIDNYISYVRNNPNIELEAIYIDKSKLTVEKFRDILTFFMENKNQYNFTGISETLDINIISNKRLEKFRTTINNKEDILRYCKTNSLKNTNIIYGEKRRINEFKPILISNYDFKLNLKYDGLVENQDVIEDINNNIKSSKKYFRYKKRYSFENVDKLFRIDLTLVKSSNKYSNRLVDSGVLSKSKYDFELEVELLNENIDKFNNKEIINNLFTIIGNVLLKIDDNKHILKNSEVDEVIKSYLKLALQLPKSKIDNYKKLNPKRNFIGPQPVTLERKNLLKSDVITNILNDYTVTEKADGERNLLYVHNNKKVYLINNRLNIRYTGMMHEDMFTILDGEYLTENKYGVEIERYLIFDTYFHKGKNVASYPLYSDTLKNTRLNFAKEFLNNGFLKKEKGFEILQKKFYMGNEDKLLKYCKKILDDEKNGVYDYHIDGLVFTPASLGVGQNNKSDDIKIKDTWKKVFKWKPPKHNSIDFLTEFIDPIMYNNKSYMLCKLYVGFNENLKIDPKKILQNNFDSKLYAKKHFVDTYLELDMDNKTFTNDGNEIFNNMIVEFTYNPEEDIEELKWKPRNIRFDKTELYRSTKKIAGTANDYKTAINVVNTINNPVTVNMITGVEEITNDIIEKETIESDVYYSREISRNESLLKPLLDFHNYWIKNTHLYKRFSNQKTLFDIACGKGGDLHKWISSNYNYVVGADISVDNLFNVQDGIYRRFNDAVKNGSLDINKNRMIFILMDASKRWNKEYLKNIPSDTDEEKQIKYFTDILFGTINKSDIEKGDSNLSKFYKRVEKQFNLASIMFAIHYMFEDNYKLDNFIDNLNDILKEGGYFFGTCLDGYLVNERLENKKIIKGEMNDKVVWMIEKKYDKYDKDPLNNIGKKISVYMESINQIIDEYLVDYDLLKLKLEKYNILPLNNEDLKKLNLNASSGSFEDVYEDNKKNIEKSINMNIVHKEYSFLNRWFIFKKYPSN